MSISRKLDPPRPTVTAPRAQAKPAVPPPPPRPPVDEAAKVALDKATGRTSSFEAFKPPHVHSHRGEGPSQGRGTTDDSLGQGDPTAGRNRGTPDDSIGVGDASAGRNRGTPDDSIGVGDPAAGRNRGTPDDSIGVDDPSAGRNRGTPDDSIGGRGPVEGRPRQDDLKLPRLDPAAAGRAGLPGETLAKMDALLTPPTSRTAVEASYVFNHEAFRAMSVADREKIVDVLAAGGQAAAQGMAEIFHSSNGSMLHSVGGDGTRLLDSLDKMAGSTTGQRMLGDLMFDLVRPGRIWQGNAPTCTVSSMQYELASQQPGEYARLIAGLAVDGKVTMRGGGELAISASASMFASSWRHDRRSTTEAVFQSAAMEFANGSDTYSVFSQESRGGNRTYRGLFPDQIRTMVGELFGVRYETREIGSDAEATAELNEILARERPNRPVLFDIDMGEFNHCVSLEGVRGDRVYYRDPTTGRTESMSKAEFRERLVAVHYAPPPEIADDFIARKYGGKLLQFV
ncbi:MAG: hypothetical protein AB1730_14640 [Myxococcota bacterium]